MSSVGERPGGSEAAPGGSTLRVLVADDEPDIRDAVVEILTSQGIEVVSVAGDAQQAELLQEVAGNRRRQGRLALRGLADRGHQVIRCLLLQDVADGA